MDGRRRQWVPLSVDVARSRTGRNLLQRFGRDGLLVWVLVLAAAKRSLTQGEFDYVSEHDGWRQLGLADDPPPFTLHEFFAYTGRIHATRTTSKRPKNDGQTTEIRAWNDWKTHAERQLDAYKKARKRGKNTRDTRTNMRGTDSDSDSDSDKGTTHRHLTPEQNAELARQLADTLKGAKA